ncbi:TonB family protein [uncultured Desulfobacter sp.]|uniref:energy transducer TonB n=1 Tax=uncultured Desulfobacter sp. TaxID=240139 RepID=UPI002AAB2ACC|nr:TonB family protein [uncultured Desulfobacter sp.]
MSIGSQIEKRARLAGEPEDTGPGVFFMVCLVSLLCHALIFISLFFLHDFKFSAPKPQVISVDLVAFESGPVRAQALEKSPGPDEPAVKNDNKVNIDAVSQTSSQPEEPKEPKIPVLKPDVSLKSKPDNLQDLIAAREKDPPREKPAEKKKKEEQKARKKAEQDLAKSKKEQAEKLERQKQNQLEKALKRMAASVASKENSTRGSNSGRTQAAGSAGGYGSAGETGALTLYQMVIKSAIEQNWIFNDAMAGLNQDLEVRIFIKILKGGDIRDISFETRSGNNYLDESAKKAVQRANPLPELPKGMSSYELVLGFSPRGLK